MKQLNTDTLAKQLIGMYLALRNQIDYITYNAQGLATVTGDDRINQLALKTGVGMDEHIIRAVSILAQLYSIPEEDLADLEEPVKRYREKVMNKLTNKE